MNEHDENQGPEVHVFMINPKMLAAIRNMARLYKTPEEREQIKAEAAIVNRFLHDEQAHLGWGSRFIMWGTAGPAWDPGNLLPLFGKVLDREVLPIRCEQAGYPADRVMAVAQDLIDRHILPCGIFSGKRPEGLAHECHASFAWPLPEEAWEEAALHGFDYGKMPDWVKTHIEITTLAARAHWTAAYPRIRAALTEAGS
jgi:hypothetical protein